MPFIDEVEIIVKSGDGGKGCVSFRREKFIPKGGPDGGDGGNGGDIILRSTTRLHSLADFSSKKYFKAQNGKPGAGKNRSGKNGLDVIIEVPVGTVVYSSETEEIITDLIENEQEVLILQGGQGGKGNQHFATSTNRVPRMAQPGLPGIQEKIRLNLKYIADVGLIGFPNAGKSTLLSSLTKANPRIDNYPFTTLDPELGVIDFEDESRLTIADIPGLIEGASDGKGLGHRFLKHVERTKLLVHLLDITHVPENDLLEDFDMLRNELENYDKSILEKTQMVLLNKIDVKSGETRDIRYLKTALKKRGMDVLAISALEGNGLEDFKRYLLRKFSERIYC